jgi:hypothetical protein
MSSNHRSYSLVSYIMDWKLNFHINGNWENLNANANLWSINADISLYFNEEKRNLTSLNLVQITSKIFYITKKQSLPEKSIKSAHSIYIILHEMWKINPFAASNANIKSNKICTLIQWISCKKIAFSKWIIYKGKTVMHFFIHFTRAKKKLIKMYAKSTAFWFLTFLGFISMRVFHTIYF